MLLFVGRTDLRIGAHHVGNHSDTGRISCCLGGIGIGLRRFDTPLQCAPQVKLVRGAEAKIPHVGHRDLIGQQERFTGLLKTLGARLHRAAPSTCRLRLLNLSPCTRQVGCSHTQVCVGGHGLAH